MIRRRREAVVFAKKSKGGEGGDAIVRRHGTRAGARQIRKTQQSRTQPRTLVEEGEGLLEFYTAAGRAALVLPHRVVVHYPAWPMRTSNLLCVAKRRDSTLLSYKQHPKSTLQLTLGLRTVDIKRETQPGTRRVFGSSGAGGRESGVAFTVNPARLASISPCASTHQLVSHDCGAIVRSEQVQVPHAASCYSRPLTSSKPRAPV